MTFALGPLDGRYRATTTPLTAYLSEAALNRERIRVEIEWLIFLSREGVVPGAPVVDKDDTRFLRSIPTSFGQAEVAELAAIESETRHDVKAVEYFIRWRLDAAPATLGPATVLPALSDMVHAFCTSEDVNNLAYALCIKGAIEQVWLPAARALADALAALARQHAGLPMLSHTHGQTATPTTVGKEMAVFAARLSRQIRRVQGAEYLGKLNGATGTFGAHVVAVPEADWPALSRAFVESLGLVWNPLTTQIEPHDWQADLYADVAHANRIAHNLATDMWTYISLDYFHQRLAAQGSTGSSTMPHKVNPIRFENAEANLEISSALLETALGHSLLAFDNLVRGLAGVEPNPAKLAADLDASWEVLAEPIQQAMRAAGLAGATGMGNAYERLKELTRGRTVTAQDMREAIASLGMPDDVAARLSSLTPGAYTGLAAQLVAYLDKAGQPE